MFAPIMWTSIRHFPVCVLVLLASACGGSDNAPAPAAGCALSATHQVTWSDSAAPDTITARAEGPSCAQATITLAARNAHGDPLWAFASTYTRMKAGEGAPPDSATPVANAEMEQFLAGWADVTEQRTAQLPQWRTDAATLTASVETFSYSTPFPREAYEMLRARDLPMICYAAGVEDSQCLVIDPASHAPALIVAYGP
jgi:hypothetical protein